MRRSIFWITVTICIVHLSCSCWGADEKTQLRSIRKEITAKKSLITKTVQVENRVSRELAQIDKSLKEKETSLAVLNQDLHSVESSLQKTRQEIDRVQKDAEARKLLLQRRLVAVYKAGEVGSARFLFSSKSFPQMLENLRYMKALVGYDRRLVESYNDRIEQLKELKGKMEDDARQKERLKSNIESKKREIQEEKNKKASYLDKVREDKKSYLASLRQLEANSRRLQSVVERLEAARRKSYTSKARKQSVAPGRSRSTPFIPPSSSSGFASERGRLSLPVQGRIVGSYGRHKHPEFNSFTISNGISIAAPIGTDVRSIYEGKVVFAEYFKGYGNMMIVDHGDGFYSLYAHNSKLFKRAGSAVTKNEVIASVGDIDSTKGPVLYLEIRYQGRPIDPSPWIR